MCLEMGKREAKAVSMSMKCNMPLQPKCFKANHVPNAAKPN